jgi:putative ABC transport system permease protein
VEHIRQQAKESFNRTVSGVDLIVGAPSGQLNLLLYSVFRMGSPTNNINFKNFKFLN